jgi:hypothetical protein
MIQLLCEPQDGGEKDSEVVGRKQKAARRQQVVGKMQKALEGTAVRH